MPAAQLQLLLAVCPRPRSETKTTHIHSTGYALYHWSGLSIVVDGIRRVTGKSERKSDAQNETTLQLFSALRMLAKSYVATVPGAGILVDVAFDQVEGIVDAHQEEARAILKTAMEDIQIAVKAHGKNSKAAAWDVLIILRDKLGQIQASASGVGQNKIGPLFENFDGFREHANQRIPQVLASVHSLRSAAQKGLEKVRSLAFQLNRVLLKRIVCTGKEHSIRSVRKTDLWISCYSIGRRNHFQ